MPNYTILHGCRLINGTGGTAIENPIIQGYKIVSVEDLELSQNKFHSAKVH